MGKGVDPYKMTKMIGKKYIITVAGDGGHRRLPDIRKHQFERACGVKRGVVEGESVGLRGCAGRTVREMTRVVGGGKSRRREQPAEDRRRRVS